MHLYPISTYLPEVVAAIVVGYLVGIERYVQKKVTNVNVFSGVCLTACVIVRSAVLFGGTTANVYPIPAAVITGFGFAAAALIMKRDNMIEGVTTAIMLLLVGAIGVAFGFGIVDLPLVAIGLFMAVNLATCKVFREHTQLSDTNSGNHGTPGSIS